MTVRILLGDVREKLRELPDASVHCVVTSPPYWGLRDYGTSTWEGGNPGCNHYGRQARRTAGSQPNIKGNAGQVLRDGVSGIDRVCERCGAIKRDQQLGLEPTPQEFVANMVAVFREVKRVLRDDGTLWLNLGDSYAGGGGYPPDAPCNIARQNGESWGSLNPSKQARRESKKGTGAVPGLKSKDLCGIPWRVAFALQADGWWLRQDIIWHKPNPMPESIKDRCTKAHEYLFLLSKSARYHFDAAAISEAAEYGYSPTPQMFNGVGTAKSAPQRKVGSVQPGDGGTRNRRSVWTINTEPFPEAHFATFPTALVEPCIKAGCPVGGTVLDPFGGAGTTGLVADRLGRHAVLIELNPEYAAMAQKRIVGDCPMFTEAVA